MGLQRRTNVVARRLVGCDRSVYFTIHIGFLPW
jgi:hypothetical protein